MKTSGSQQLKVPGTRVEVKGRGGSVDWGLEV